VVAGGHEDVRTVEAPPRLGAIADLTPVRDQERPTWLALGEDGTISRWDVRTGDHEAVGTTTVTAEPDHEP
jgi:hypothetical protein